MLYLTRAVERGSEIRPPLLFFATNSRRNHHIGVKLRLPVYNWIADPLIQEISKSVHKFSCNSGVKTNILPQRRRGGRRRPLLAAWIVHCAGAGRFRLYIALLTADYDRFASNLLWGLRNVQAILWSRIFENWPSSIAPYANFYQNLRCRVVFCDFFGRFVVECPRW